MVNGQFLGRQSSIVVLSRFGGPAQSILRILFLFGLLDALFIAKGKEQTSILPTEVVSELSSAIKTAEKNSLSNLKVESEVWVETKLSLSDPCEPWKRTPIYLSATAWFDGHSTGKARLDVHKQVLEWRDGAAEYIEESYSTGFDGQYGRLVRITTGPLGKPVPIKESSISREPPGQLRAGIRSCTGAQFSLQFFFANEDVPNARTLSGLFGAATSTSALRDKAFEAGIEEFQGVKCIKFGSGKKKWGCETWWLDPSRGFSLLGYEQSNIRDGTERLLASMRVTQLKEVSPGVWWPTEATLISGPLKPGGLYRRTVYRASSIVANDPKFDETIFTVPIPQDYLVDDKEIGSRYKIGQDQ